MLTIITDHEELWQPAWGVRTGKILQWNTEIWLHSA